MTLAGTIYPKGLGTNSVSDVAVHLGANCSKFTATVGIDSDTGNGTVTFTVVGDGKALATTPVVKDAQPAQQITADFTGVQTLHVLVGDAGDGNGYDYA